MAAPSAEAAAPPQGLRGLARGWLPPRPTRILVLHAGLTLLAVLILLAATHGQALRVRLIAATSAAFLMQCHGVGSRRYRRASTLVCTLALAGMVSAGSALVAHPLVQEALLVAVAGGVFAVREWLPDRGRYPIFLFTATLIGCVVGTDTHTPRREGAFVLLAGAVATALLACEPIPPPVPAVTEPRHFRPALRAALAAALTSALEDMWALPRAYWAVLVAVVSTSQSREELRHRAADRLTATLLGCACGWLLAQATLRVPLARWPLLLAAIATAVLFRTLSLRLFVFFLTIYVTMLLVILGTYTPGILLARCYETGIGLGFSLLCEWLIPPTPVAATASAPTTPAPSSAPHA